MHHKTTHKTFCRTTHGRIPLSNRTTNTQPFLSRSALLLAAQNHNVLYPFHLLFGVFEPIQRPKAEDQLRILLGRIKLLREKRESRIKSIEQDLKKVLLLSQQQHVEVALKKCDSIARERNFLLILEEIREFATMVLETHRDLDLTGSENKQLRTAISSMFYAAGTSSSELTNDLPELKSIANELAKKFGKEFRLSCEREKTSEACGVSKQFMQIVAKKVRKDMKSDDVEARMVLEKMAKEIGVELPRVAEKKKKPTKKKKKKSTRDSSSEASGGNSSSESECESGDSNKKSSSSRRKGNKTSNYATAETAAKAARAAANKAQEAAEYAEALVATNELLATTTTTSSSAGKGKITALDSNDLDFENEEGKEAEINAVIAAALDEVRLEEETEEGNENENENGNENAAPTKEKPTLGGRGRGGPPPGIASSRETKLAKSDPTTTAADDDALADRFEKLKFSKR